MVNVSDLIIAYTYVLLLGQFSFQTPTYENP